MQFVCFVYTSIEKKTLLSNKSSQVNLLIYMLCRKWFALKIYFFDMESKGGDNSSMKMFTLS